MQPILPRLALLGLFIFMLWLLCSLQQLLLPLLLLFLQFLLLLLFLLQLRPHPRPIAACAFAFASAYSTYCVVVIANNGSTSKQQAKMKLKQILSVRRNLAKMPLVMLFLLLVFLLLGLRWFWGDGSSLAEIGHPASNELVGLIVTLLCLYSKENLFLILFLWNFGLKSEFFYFWKILVDIFLRTVMKLKRKFFFFFNWMNKRMMGKSCHILKFGRFS